MAVLGHLQMNQVKETLGEFPIEETVAEEGRQEEDLEE
jgi:hypothetical protein